MADKKIRFTLSEIDSVVAMLRELMPTCCVFTFSGQLGAGKSTLIRSLLRSLGVWGVIASPTFTYMAQYENEQGERLYHFDLYRIATLEEFVAAGFNEYLYQPYSWCFVEWPDVIRPLLTHAVCNLRIEYVDPTTREMEVEIIP